MRQRDAFAVAARPGDKLVGDVADRRVAPSDAGSTVAATAWSVATASGVSSRGCAKSLTDRTAGRRRASLTLQQRASFHVHLRVGLQESRAEPDIVKRCKRCMSSCPRGDASSPATCPPCRSKSPASVRFAAPAATPTATIISAATSRCARSATSRARSSSTACSPSSIACGRCTCRSSAASRWSAIRELNTLLPILSARGIHVQLVTSAVREIPAEWRSHRPPLDRGLDRRPAAGARRAPQAGDLRPHPEAHRRAQHHRALHGHAPAGEPTRLSRRVPASSGRRSTEVEKIWMSLYTPQVGEVSDERLRPADRERVVADLLALRQRYPKLALPKGLIEVYANPPDVAGRVRLRADDDDDLGRLQDADHAVPVRRQRPTAATAAASRRPVWPPSRATAVRASSRSGRSSTDR